MKKLLFAICLLCSFSVYAVDPNVTYAREWNRQFALINMIPDDRRSEQVYLMGYYKTMVANNRARGGNAYKLPGEIVVPVAPPPVPPVVNTEPPFNPAQYPQIAPGTMARDMIIKLKQDIDALYNLR